jgi:hypothetical protein
MLATSCMAKPKGIVHLWSMAINLKGLRKPKDAENNKKDKHDNSVNGKKDLGNGASTNNIKGSTPDTVVTGVMKDTIIAVSIPIIKHILTLPSNLKINMKNVADILGVSYNADKYQIKLAYRKKAKEYHPDINKSPDATKMFQQITDAYEFLSEENISRYRNMNKS